MWKTCQLQPPLAYAERISGVGPTNSVCDSLSEPALREVSASLYHGRVVATYWTLELGLKMGIKKMLGLFVASVIGSTVIAERFAVAQTTLSGQTDLARLTDLCAQKLNLRISYDEGALKSRVTLRQDKPMTDMELWQLTNRLLAEQGFTSVRAGDDETIAIVKIASAAQVARVERAEQLAAERNQHTLGGIEPIRPGFRRVLVPLQRASSKDVLSAVQLVLSKPGGIATESEQAGLVMIADLTPYLDVALKLIEQLDGAEGGAVVKEIPARNIDPTRLASQAKQLADKRKAVGGREVRGELVPAAGGNGVLLICPPAFVQAWESIIASVDQREPVERRTYQPGSFGLKDVSGLIEQTVKGGTGITGATAADDRWKVIQDDLTGSLIITATPSQHEQITELMQRLASVPAESRRPVKTFKIRNRGVKEVQQLIEDLLRAGVLEAQATNDATAFGGSGSNTSASIAAAGSQTTPRAFEPGGTPVPTFNSSAPSGSSTPVSGTTLPSNLPPLLNGTGRGAGNRGRDAVGGNAALTLTSDEATNTLIAVGEPRLLNQLEHLLPTLDVRQPQVMIEAILVSMNDSQTLNFGIELEHLRVSGDTMIRLSSLFGLSTAAAGAAGSGASRAVGDASGFTGTVLDPGDFSVVVRALETLNKGRSMSMPKILINNNQQATFNSVLQQPFATTNASNTVSTTAFGGTQDAGTTISVKPQIAEGDHLVLTYSVSLSSFVGSSASANVPPPRQQNSVQSVATIPDGYTVVVGGLELNTDGNDTTQIPIVGDIPLIGELFKNRSRNLGRQRFYVFLRASVLRQSNLEDLKYLSDIDASAAAVPDGWPVVEPRVIR